MHIATKTAIISDNLGLNDPEVAMCICMFPFNLPRYIDIACKLIHLFF